MNLQSLNPKSKKVANYGREEGRPSPRQFRTGHKTFTSRTAELFRKQALVTSTLRLRSPGEHWDFAGQALSDGLHRGSDRAVEPGWRGYYRDGCRPGDELRAGLLS